MTIGNHYDAANELMKEIHAIQVKKQQLVQDIFRTVKSVQYDDNCFEYIIIGFEGSNLVITLENDLGDFNFTTTQLGEIERKIGTINTECNIIPRGGSLVIEIPLSKPTEEQESKNKEWDEFLYKEYGHDHNSAYKRARMGVF